MYIPYDDKRGIHPQDASFLERERWDFANTPADRYPLLLHYHPLVIYRFQVLKQADVVLAMVLQRDTFSDEQRRRNFDYYDALTTGDSSLSACVQALSAAQIGYEDAAVDYFRQALFVDLADTHGNSGDGVHIASAAGVWSTVAFGFAGLRATPLGLTFSPRLPAAWDRIRFRMQHHGTRLLVDLDDDGCEVHVLGGPAAQVVVEDHPTQVGPGQSVRIPRCAGPG